MSIHQHASDEVRRAFTRLADELCQWERATGRQSVLIFRGEGGAHERLLNGKPGIPNDIPDVVVLEMVKP